MATQRNEKEFTRTHLLTTKVVRDLKIVTVPVAELIIEGIATEDETYSEEDPIHRWDVVISNVWLQGVDIRDVLDATGGLTDIEDAMIQHHVPSLFRNHSKAA